MNYSCGGNLPKYFLDSALQGILTELFVSGKLRGLQGYPLPPTRNAATGKPSARTACKILSQWDGSQNLDMKRFIAFPVRNPRASPASGAMNFFSHTIH